MTILPAVVPIVAEIIIGSWVYMASALLAFALIIALLFEVHSRRKLERATERTRRYEEQFRIAAQQSGRRVVRYDIAQDAVCRYDAGENGEDAERCGSGLQEAIASIGRIAEESLPDFAEFCGKLREGQSPLSAEFRISEGDGEYRWYRFMSTTLFGVAGQPETAVISFFDDTEQRERGIAFAKWQQELAELHERDDVYIHEWNLTKNICENEPETRLSAMDSAWREQKFDERARYYAESFVSADDRGRYAAFMQRERLIGAYYDGTEKEAIEYRMRDAAGKLRWMRLTAQLVPYPESNDVKAYLMLEDIDDEKARERERIARSENDALTGALNRATFTERMNALLAERSDATHALLMLDLDEFKLINDSLGHAVGDKVLIDMVACTRSVLRTSDLIGRLGGDEFLVCLRDISYDAAISDKAEQICNALSRTIGSGFLVSVSIGIAVFPRDGDTFDTLYKAADAALYRAKFNGRNRYEFFEKSMLTASGQPAQAGALSAHTRPRVLLCAPEASCEQLSGMLAGQYDVATAHDLDEALKQFSGSHGKISLVIYDLDSVFGADPDLPCLAAAARAGIPAFVLTKRTSEEDLLSIINAGAKNILAKPLREKLFRARIAQIVNERNRSARQLQSGYMRLHQSDEERFRTLLNATGTAVFIYDPETRVYTVDPMINHYIVGNFDGRYIADVLREDGVTDEAEIARGYALARGVFAGECDSMAMNALCKTPENERRWFCLKIFRLKSHGEMTQKVLVTLNDVHSQVKAEEALRFRAERDALTGLYNRATFFEIAANMIKGQSPGYYALSSFDVESFKMINDQYGTEMGDKVLRHIAVTLEQAVSEIGGIACRISADDFAAMYPVSEGGMLADIAAQYDHAVTIDATQLYITLSVGRYVIDDPKLPVSAMYDRALLAKRTVKGRYDVHLARYEESMRARILQEQALTREADHALHHEEFQIYLQPQCNHTNGALIGAEALARWMHPERGMIFPGVCVPIFERNGFIFALDRYIWEQACRVLRRWLDMGKSPLPISVNVSRKDVFHFDFYSVITGLVEQYALPVSLLALEITESAFAEAPEQIIHMVQRLRAYGFTIEIDDFGSGYSSLNTLRTVPADILKLDMRFLSDAANGVRGEVITESVVRMAGRLNMPVIAEGVETKAQADFLSSIGCPYVQGYLYAKPMQVAEFEAFREGVTSVERPLAGENR